MRSAAWIPALIMLAVALTVVGAAQAQVWPHQPEDPVWQAERLRLERERWRTGLELRALQAQADDARTRSTLNDIQARRGAALASPPRGAVYLGPVDPALVDPNLAAATQARESMEQGLSGISDYLDRTRPD